MMITMTLIFEMVTTSMDILNQDSQPIITLLIDQ